MKTKPKITTRKEFFKTFVALKELLKSGFTEIEFEVISKIAESEKTDKEIASEMGLTEFEFQIILFGIGGKIVGQAFLGEQLISDLKKEKRPKPAKKRTKKNKSQGSNKNS